MGWLSSACSFVGSCVSSVGSCISSAWSATKSIAGRAVGWMAEKASNFIGAVSNVWDAVKTYVKPALKLVKFIPWPPLQKAALILESVINILEKKEKGLLPEKIAKAIQWTITAAKNIKEFIIDEGERREAEERKKYLREAQQYLEGDEAQSVQISEIINEFVIVQSEIDDIFKKDIVRDFDHYLRLRATQKLLALTEIAFSKGNEISSIGKGELFLLEIGRELLKAEPKIDDASLDMLNGLIKRRYGKDLIPFVFEEMIMAWSKNLTSLEESWEVGNKTLAKDTINLRNLENNIKFGSELTSEEMIVLDDLRKTVPELKLKQEQYSKEINNMRNYVYAAEGFLQILEEDKNLEDKEYLIQEGSRVGMIIIDCAQNGKKWDALTEEEQDLIIDFANIFKEDCKSREKHLVKVEVAA